MNADCPIASLLRSRFYLLASLLLIAASAGAALNPSPAVPRVRGLSKGLNFRGAQVAPVEYRGTPATTAALAAGEAVGTALASADLDRDGVPDLVITWRSGTKGIVVVRRGNSDAYAPKDNSVYVRMQQGYDPAPLSDTAVAYEVPEPADFLGVGDFNGDGVKDVVVAARGGGLYLLTGDGAGALGRPQHIALPGTVTAMAAGEFGRFDGRTEVAAGVATSEGAALLIFNGEAGLTTGDSVRFDLPANASGVVFGALDEDAYQDVAVSTGNQIAIIHGWEPASSPAPLSRLEMLDAGGSVRDLAAGFFVWTREARTQLASLAADGTVRILNRGALNTRPFSESEISERAKGRSRSRGTSETELGPSWQSSQREQWMLARQFAATEGASAVLTRAHVSPLQTDDLMVAGGSATHLDIMRQRDIVPSGPQVQAASAASDFTTMTFDLPLVPLAALVLPPKLNGVRNIALLQPHSSALTIIALAGVTITVDRTDDPAGAALTAASVCGANPNDCSLRGAVQFANANAGTTINLGSNTYTLTISGAQGCTNIGEPAATGNTLGDLEINETTTVMGTGEATTIIRQAAPTNDRVVCMDVPLTGGHTYTFSALTVTGGRDLNSNCGGGGFLGGAKNTTLNLTNVTFVNNQTNGGSAAGGGGAGITGGDMNVTNCTFGAANLPSVGASRTDMTLGNLAEHNSGGGLNYSTGDPAGTNGATGTLTMVGTTFTHNAASGSGGGALDVYCFNVSTGTGNISTTTFSNNQGILPVSAPIAATASGGAILNESLTTLNVGTTSITSNATVNRGGAIYVGGGSLVLNGTNPSVTMSGNTAASGGSSISTASATSVSGTNTTIGGDIEVSTGGTWTNNVGSAVNPTNMLLVGGTVTNNNTTMNLGGDLTVTPQVTLITGAMFNTNSGTVNVAGNLAITAGGSSRATTFNGNTGSVSIGGNFTLTSVSGVSSTFNGNSAAVSVGGNLTFKGAGESTAFNAGSSSFTFNGSGARSIGTSGTLSPTFSGLTFNNLTVDKSAGTLTLGVDTPIVGNLNVNQGTLDLATFLANRTAAGGTLTVNSGATLKIGGPNALPTNYSTRTLSTTSTVEYEGTPSPAGNQTITAVNYGHLTSSGTGARVLPSGSTVGVAGAFTPGANAYTVTGSTVDFNGSGGQTIPAFSFNNLTSSSTGSRTLAPTGTIAIAGTFTPGANTYTVTGSTVEYNGSGAQALPSSLTTYNNLTLNNSAGTTGFAGLIVQGLLHVQNGTFASAGSYKNVQIDAAKTWASSASGAIGVSGNWANDGSFTANGGTVTFNGSSAQTLSGAATTTFNNLTIASSGGVSLSADATVNGTVNFSSGNLGVGARQLTLNGTVSSTSGTIASGATGTVNYNQGSDGQAVLAGTYGNLTFSNSIKTLPNSGIVKIAGTFSVGAMGGHTITGSTIEFNGTSAQSLPANFTTYENLTINNSAGVSLSGDVVVTGVLKLTSGVLNVGAHKITVSNPIQGTVANFNAGATSKVVIAGTVSGVNLPANVTALTDLSLTNTNSIGTTLQGNLTVSGMLTLSGGILDAGANTLALTAAGTLSRTSGYVTGNLKKTYSGTGSFTYQVGTANGFSPMAATITAGTGDLTVKAVQGVQPSLTAGTSLKRYWTLTGTGVTTNLTFNYLDPTDIAGTEANYHMVKVTGTAPSVFANSCPSAPCVDTTLNAATVNGVSSSSSDWSLTEGADLSATKTNDAGGSVAFPGGWNWTIHVSNAGGTAIFNTGQTLLSDNLPNTTIAFGSPIVQNASGVAGTINCSITTFNLVCTAGTTVTVSTPAAFDVVFSATPSGTGAYANPRGGGAASVDPNGVVAETNEANNAFTDTVTVVAPDLTVSKTNNVTGAATLGNTWTWTITLANSGTGAAVFADGQTIFSDNLPDTNIGYSAVSVVGTPSNVTNSGNISCTINGTKDLICKASGAAVTLGPTNGSYAFSFVATPTATGTFVNPRLGGNATIDPANVIVEGNEGNNTATNTVTVTAPDLSVTKTNNVGGAATLPGPWTWTITLANTGNGPAVFTPGQTIFSDNLPNANISYGSVAVVGTPTNVTNSANISCTIDGTTKDLVCIANGATVTFGATTGSYRFSFVATPATIGVFANPRVGGSATIDPLNAIVESNEGNNTVSDTVTITAPDLVATKTNNVSGTTTLGNNWTWTVTLANTGNAPAVFTSGQTIFSDNLPDTNISYGGVSVVGTPTNVTNSANISCTINVTKDLVCQASGATVTLGATTGSYVFSFIAMPAAAGVFANPRASGTASIDPNNNITESNESNNAVANSVTVINGADLLISISKAGPASALAGDPAGFDYTITVTNNGPIANVGGFTVTDVLPTAVLTFHATGSDPLCSASGQTVTCTNTAGLGNGAHQDFIVHVTLASSAIALLNTATVESNGTTDAVPGNNSSTATTTVQTQADLAMSESGPPTAIAGAGFHYTLFVTNSGPSDSNSITVKDVLPIGLSFQTTGSDAGCSVVGQTVTCTTSAILASALKAFTVQVTLASSAISGSTLSNTASITATGTMDNNNTNDTSGAIVTTVQTNGDLSISKNAPPTVIAGAAFDYSLTVTNNGPSDNTGGFTVTDALPAAAVFTTSGSDPACSLNAGTVICAGSALSMGSAKTFTIHVNVPTSTASGLVLQNSATVATSGTTDPIGGNNTSTTTNTTVQTSADLAIGKSAPATTIAGAAAGFDYVLTVTNNGPSDNTGGFTVTDVLPAGTVFSFSGSTAGASVSGQTITYTNGAGLAASGTQTFTIHVTVPASTADATVLSNSATVATTGTTDPDSVNNTAGASTTVQARADLAISKVAPATTIAGAAAGYDYTLTVTNNGPSDNVGGFTITDVLSSFTMFSASGSTTGCSAIGQTVTCVQAGGLAVSATNSVTIHVTVPSSILDGKVVVNTGTVVSAGTVDSTPANDTSNTTHTAVQARADLSIALTGPASALAGAAAGFDYAVTVTNNGPSDSVDGYSVSDVLPVGLTFSSSGSTPGCSAAAQTVTCLPVSGLVNGGTASFTVHVTLAASATSSAPLTNSATVTPSATIDPVNGNNTSNTVVTSIATQADLAVTKSGAAGVVAGNNLTYTIVVTNNGPSDAQGVVLTDVLPVATVFVSQNQTAGPVFTLSHSGNNVSDSIATLGAGASGTFSVVAQVNPGAASGSVLNNAASVAATTTDTTPGNNTSGIVATTVSTQADLAVTKSAASTAPAGANLVYTIAVTNNGPSSAQNVTLVDTLPAGTTFVSQSQTNGPAFTLSNAGNAITDTIATLAPGASATLDVTAKISASAANNSTISNTASVSTTTSDLAAGNNNASASTTVVAQADVAITKSGPSAVLAGSPLVYTITATNNGPSDATDVVVSDPGAAGITFASNSGGCTSTFPCSIGTLTPGQSITINSTWSVPPVSAGTTVTNIATVSASSSDPTSSNDSASANTTINIAPAITLHPSPQTVCEGQAAAFTAASSGVPTPTVQWQVSTDGGATFNDLGGATAASLTFTASAAQNGNRYRAVFTNGGGSATSNAAMLTVNTLPAVTLQPVTQSVCENTSVTFTAGATASPAAGVQWQVSTNGGATFSDIPGAIAASYTHVALATESGNRYRARFTNVCNTSASNAATLTVNRHPVITSPPGAILACVGAPVTFDVGTNSTGFTYQWRKNGVNIGGATGSQYSIGSVTADDSGSYDVVVSGSCPPAVTSPPALLTVRDVLAGVSGSQTICAGDSAVINILLNGNAPWHLIWSDGFEQKATTNSVTRTVSPASTSTYTLTSVTDSFCGAGTTFGAATVTVIAAPEAGIAAPSSVVAGSTGNSASVTPTAGATYNWSIIGGTIASGNGTSAITWTAGSTSAATISVTVQAHCAVSSSVAVAVTAIASGPCSVSAPSTLSPANGATVTNANVPLQWIGSAGASGYRVLMSVDGAVASIVATPAAGETSANVIVAGTNVEWFIESLFDGCPSTFSPHATFHVAVPLACPASLATLLQPNDGATRAAGQVSFSWQVVTSAVAYELYAARESGDPTLLAVTSDPSVTVTLAGGGYQWFVRTIFSGCPPTESLHRSLTVTACDALVASAPISPIDGTSATAGVIDFSWSGIPNATGYTLWIASGDAPAQAQPTSTGTVAHIQRAAGPIQWHVQTAFACGSIDSAERSLLVVAPPQGCPLPVTPLFTSYPPVVVAGQPYTIRWSASPNATYQIEESRTGDFTDAVSRNVAEAVAVYPATSATGRRYYRVRAVSTCGAAPSVVSNSVRVEVTGQQITNDIIISLVLGSGVSRFTLDLSTLFGSGKTATAAETFTITSNQPWLAASPSVGSLTLGSVEILADGSTLHPGITEGELSVTLSGGRLALVRIFANVVSGVSTQPKTAAPPDSLIIPAIAHVSGIGARFQSDVRLANVSAVVQSYRLIFTPTGSGGGARVLSTNVDIQPGQTIALDDVLTTWFGVSAGEGSSGSLEIRTTTNGDLPAVSSRTYAVTAAGTYGQFIPAIPISHFAGKGMVLSLQQIAQSADYRTNVGLVEASGSPAVVDFSVFDPSGTRAGGFTQSIGGGEHMQLNSVLALHGISLDDGRIEARVTSDRGAVAVYASVVDNHTGDPMLVDGVVPSQTSSTRYVLPGIADLSGGAANWRSDVRLYNPSSATADLTLRFNAATVPLTIASGEVKVLNDVLRSTFGLTNIGGALHVTSVKPVPLVATARTYNRTSSGTYGQFIPAVTVDQAVGSGDAAIQLLQLEESPRTRTNVGIAEVSGSGAKIEIDLDLANGSTSRIVVDLAPFEFRQLNQIIRSITPDSAYNVRATVRVISGSGRVTAYASAIDNSTQDPTYIPGQ